MLKRYLALVAVGLVGVALAGFYLLPGNSSPTGGVSDLPDARAAEPVKPGADPFGFSAAFDLEIKKVGQISPREFAARYPTPKYLDKPSFDPTTAKFFAQVNAEKVKKRHGAALASLVWIVAMKAGDLGDFRTGHY